MRGHRRAGADRFRAGGGGLAGDRAAYAEGEAVRQGRLTGGTAPPPGAAVRSWTTVPGRGARPGASWRPGGLTGRDAGAGRVSGAEDRVGEWE
ncbi:hypothetical protein GCM10022244_30920 [Streptomyces gulbargensis]|uniref:Uncharacterized protein n=1 Tax=Streptomyces gulbargensis TaxID=364901 RepID=A0ABP7MBI4_9ACTN